MGDMNQENSLMSEAELLMKETHPLLYQSMLDARIKYQRFVNAMAYQQEGNLEKAAQLLEAACNPPSEYKGHYEALFKIWRSLNKEELKAGSYSLVVERVMKMIRYDSEMIAFMLQYWGERQNRELPSDWFDRDRNLKITDVKALHKAAGAIGDEAALETAVSLAEKRFQKILI